MSTTVTLCFANGLQFNPAIVHVDFNYITIRSTNTVAPQYRIEKDKDNLLYDMVQKYSSGEISREQYIRTSELKTKQERNYEIIILSTCIYLF